MIAASTSRAATPDLAPRSYEIRFAHLRWREGVAGLTVAAVMIGMGIFSFCQIPVANALAFQLAIIGTFLLICGGWFAAAGARDLFGKLELDDRGIRLTPFWAGFRLRWSDLDRWSLEDQLGSGLPELVFWTQESGARQVVPRGLVTAVDASVICDIVQAHNDQRIVNQSDLEEATGNLSVARR
jgi:hypothetical protein